MSLMSVDRREGKEGDTGEGKEAGEEERESERQLMCFMNIM